MIATCEIGHSRVYRTKCWCPAPVNTSLAAGFLPQGVRRGHSVYQWWATLDVSLTFTEA